MTRRILAILLASLVALGGLAATADEPPPGPDDAPLRLKKKPKPADNKADPAKPAAKKADEKKPEEQKPDEKKPEEAKEGPAPTAPEQDEKEVMERLSRNVRSVADRLKDGELNEGTRQLQEDILKDIESLIRRSESPQGGGGGAQQEQNQDQQNQDQQNQDQQNQGKQGQSKGKQGSARSKGGSASGPGSPGQGQPKDGQQQSSRGKGRQRGQMARSNNQPGKQRLAGGNGQPQRGGDDPGEDPSGQSNSGNIKGKDKNRAELSRNADLDKQDVWGHLPESLRATMNAYAGRQEFMAKHEALIKKYYSTIATEGRRKGDGP